LVTDRELKDMIASNVGPQNLPFTNALLQRSEAFECHRSPDEQAVELRMKTGEYPSIAEVILNEAVQIGAGTIVIGPRGISKKEEFIYGSTSNKILHSQNSCTALWVVQ
jgi:nucleotide-binding universal stress UspA family protein